MKHLVAAFCVVAALTAGCSKEQVDEYAMISFMIGDVKINNIAAEIGGIIKQSDTIVTEAGAFCDVKIGGSIIRIKEKSKVLFSSILNNKNFENTTLGLENGKMLCKPKKLLKSESFFVKTPTAVAGVRGTHFAVETDKTQTTRIKVFEGSVKIAKRVRQFEDRVEKVLEHAPEVTEKEKVIITKKEVDTAEKFVDQVLKKEGDTANEVAIESVIEKTKAQVVVADKNIEKFEVTDFNRENKEIIEVKEKPKEVIQQIARAVKKDREAPRAEGRLLITRHEVYFIKDGNIVWQGKMIGEPARKERKLFVASGDYVFCALEDGNVLWRVKLPNDGKLDLRNDILSVYVNGKETMLDPDSGKRL